MWIPIMLFGIVVLMIYIFIEFYKEGVIKNKREEKNERKRTF